MLADWGNVRFFLAVGRAGSFNAAAGRLGASQPTVSRRIAALEMAIGAPLFDRHPEGLVLTELGRALWDKALNFEEAALSFERGLAAQSSTASGEVRISTTEGLGAFWLTPRLAAFAAQNPSLRFEVILENQAADLLRREADIALRLTRPITPDLVAKKVGQLSFGLFASPEYVAAHGHPSSIDALRHYRLVTLSLRQSMPDEVWQDLLDAGTSVAYSSNSSIAEIAAVRAGYGIGLLPRYAGALFGLIPVLEGQRWRQRELWLVVHPEVRVNARVRLVFDEVVRIFRKEGAGLSNLPGPDFEI